MEDSGAVRGPVGGEDVEASESGAVHNNNREQENCPPSSILAMTGDQATTGRRPHNRHNKGPSSILVPRGKQRHHEALYGGGDFEAEFTPKTAVEEDEIQRELEDRMVDEMKLQARKRSVHQPLVFTEVLPLIRTGVQSLAKDDFTICFESKRTPRWNHTVVLSIMWVLGIIIRYVVLFPVKVLIFMVGTSMFLSAMSVVFWMRDGRRKKKWMRTLIQFWSRVWITSWFGVIRYHGVFPVRKLNQIYVANHTSLIDFIVLLNQIPFATVGQQHGGLIAFLQKTISSLGNIWFDRFESRDRAVVSRRLQEHINDPENPPLLIFPEGVCVNNEHVVMFRKGAFDIGATVCPIAIRYKFRLSPSELEIFSFPRPAL